MREWPLDISDRASRGGIDLVELAPSQPVLPALIRSIRLHQWFKNLLIFVPLLFLGQHTTVVDVATFLSAFLIFGLLTSGTYLINDIIDVEADRLHPGKKKRPIASGDLSLPVAFASAAGLIGCALAGALLLSMHFALAVLSYLLLTLAYSISLKRIPLIDVLVIASLFTLRLVAGKTLTELPPSHWLLLFSLFFFYSLALMKREVELKDMGARGATALVGRGYMTQDSNFIMTLGVSSGVASLVVFALFAVSMIEERPFLYASPEFLWGTMAALSYWMMRMWLLSTRGVMNEDPVLYAVHDRASITLGGVTVAFMIAAICVKI